jgi:glc operon protein GlcG
MKSIASLAAAAALASCATAALAAEAAPLPPAYGPGITLEQARPVVAAAQAEARKRGINITVAVVDSAGYLVLEERMNGASQASTETVMLKAKSAVMWQRPTSAWLAAIEASHGAQTNYPGVIAGNGGEMLIVGGKIVGGVGIGGSGPNELDIGKIAAAAVK